MVGNFHSVPKSILKTWPTPNYVDPISRDWMAPFSGTLLAVSTVMVSFRFYLRARRKVGDFGLDDLFMALGWLLSIGVTTLSIISANTYGLDRHTWDVPPTEYVGAAKTGWVAQILFLISTVATKTSVLLFYRRMVKNTYSWRWLYAIYIALGCNAAYFFGVLFTYCMICHPLSAYWLSYDFSYNVKFTCIDGNVFSITVGVLSILSDVYAVALPCAMLSYYDLNIPRREKIGLNVIFGLGTIVAGCGMGRTYYLWRINHTYDTSWTGYTLYVWSLLECHLSIIFACAPALRAFLRGYRKRKSTWAYASSNRDRSMSSLHNASTVHGSDMMSDVEKARTRAALYGSRSHSDMGKEVGSPNRDTWSTNRYSNADVWKPLPPVPAQNLRKYSRHGYGSYNRSESRTAQEWI